MHLAFHGGLCCGIKTIYGMGDNPEDWVYSLDKVSVDDSDQYGHHVKSDQRFYHREAPAETYLQRFDRYLEYLKERRPKGIVEVAIVTKGGLDQREWIPHLEQRGFKLVTEAVNSNSGNTVGVFHLVMDYADNDDDDEEEDCGYV